MLFKVPSKKKPELKRTRMLRGSKSFDGDDDETILGGPGEEASSGLCDGRLVMGGYCIDRSRLVMTTPR